MLPVVLHIVCYMDRDRVPPIRFNCRSRVLTIYGEHRAGHTIWSHRDILDGKEVLKSVGPKLTTYLSVDPSVRSDVVVVSIDVILSPALPVGGAIDTGRRTRACRRIRMGRNRAAIARVWR